MTDDFKEQIRDRMGEPFDIDPDTRERTPTDPRAMYGYPRLAGIDPPEDIPFYKDAGYLTDAIRTVSPGDRVWVNGSGPYPVVETDQPVSGEGFVYETPAGVRREVSPTNPTNRPPGTFDSPWIRRVPGGDSEGELHALEVIWADV